MDPARLQMALQFNNPELGVIASNIANARTTPPVPAARHAKLFQDVKLPIEVRACYSDHPPESDLLRQFVTLSAACQLCPFMIL
jgi:hypothetical protein